MDLIDAQQLMDFLQDSKDALRAQALNCTDALVSVKIYAMVDAIDMIMEKVFEGPFDIETPDKEDLN